MAVPAPEGMLLRSLQHVALHPSHQTLSDVARVAPGVIEATEVIRSGFRVPVTTTALLEGWSDRGRWTMALSDPVEVRELAWNRAGEWCELVESLEPGKPWDVPDDAPFAGGWVGFVTYDASSLDCSGALWPDPPPEPPVWFARFGSGLLIGPSGEKYTIGTPAGPEPETEVAAPLKRAVSDSLDGRYPTAVAAVRSAIAAGDVYQVNLTRRFSAADDGDVMGLYRALTGDAPPISSALLRTTRWSIASASPEVLLVHDRQEGLAESRPIKGTIDVAVDEAAARLLASGKDASEHLMIVDLVRNDLGRIAQPGTVRVSRSRTLRQVGNILHLESTIVGAVGDASAADVLRVLLPAGSITGAPKRRAVGLIRALEPVPRGVYTGAIGFIDDRGRSRFSVAIRTAVVAGNEVRYHAGGGIVWDSSADLEDAESRLKAERFLRWSRE